MKAKKRDNLGQTFYVATEKAPCRNIAGFAEHAVKTAHESRAVYNVCIRILVEADDEDMPLRSGHGYKGLSLLATLLELRTRTPWLQDVSSNVRRSAAAQAHTAFGRWLEAQRLNAWKLARASDLRQKRRKTLQEVAQLRRTDVAKYRRSRKQTLESVRTMRRDAGKLTAKVERYARRNRDPLRMMRQRKNAERRQRLTFPLIAGPVRFLDDTRTELRVEGFGDVTLKRPLPDGMEPVSLTLVARRKRHHRRQRRPVRLEQLEWSAHVQYRQHVEQKPVTSDAPSVGVEGLPGRQRPPVGPRDARDARHQRRGQTRPEPGARLLETRRAEAANQESQRTTRCGLEPAPREEHEPTLRSVWPHGKEEPREPSGLPMPRVRPHRQRRRQRRREPPARSRQMAPRQSRSAEGISKGGRRRPFPAVGGSRPLKPRRSTPHAPRQRATRCQGP